MPEENHLAVSGQDLRVSLSHVMILAVLIPKDGSWQVLTLLWLWTGKQFLHSVNYFGMRCRINKWAQFLFLPEMSIAYSLQEKAAFSGFLLSLLRFKKFFSVLLWAAQGRTGFQYNSLRGVMSDLETIYKILLKKKEFFVFLVVIAKYWHGWLVWPWKSCELVAMIKSCSAF